MRLVRYSDWSRLSRGTTPRTHPIQSVSGVTLHWEGPRMGSFTHAQCAAKVRGIQDFHRRVRGWADIAYTAIVCPHGYVFEGRGPLVRSAANGTTYSNAHWYAVCYLSGQGDPFTAEAQRAFKDAVGWLRATGRAGHRVNGHRDHRATECPGAAIYGWLKAANWDSAPPPPPSPGGPVPVLDLDRLQTAARRDPGLPQGGTTYAGAVKVVERALMSEGLLARQYATDGSYGTMTRRAYAAWQRRLGYRGEDADGIPGRASLTRLGAKHGFRVKG